MPCAARTRLRSCRMAPCLVQPSPCHDRPDFEEARAQFPVLERIAYLNAGTFGPLSPRDRARRCRRELERDFEDGRSGMPYFERAMELRETARARLAAFVGVEPLHVALTSEHDGRLQHRARRASASARRRDRDDDGRALRPARAARRLGRAGRRRRLPSPRRSSPPSHRGRGCWRSRRCSGRRGACCPCASCARRRASPCSSTARSRSGRSPSSAAGLDFLTISGQKWLCGPDSTGALVVADPERLRVASPSYFSQAGYEPDGTLRAAPGRSPLRPQLVPASSLAGLLAAIDGRARLGLRARRGGRRALPRAARRARRGRDSRAERSTLVAFRAPGEPAGARRVAARRRACTCARSPAPA